MVWHWGKPLGSLCVIFLPFPLSLATLLACVPGCSPASLPALDAGLRWQRLLAMLLLLLLLGWRLEENRDRAVSSFALKVVILQITWHSACASFVSAFDSNVFRA